MRYTVQEAAGKCLHPTLRTMSILHYRLLATPEVTVSDSGEIPPMGPPTMSESIVEIANRHHLDIYEAETPGPIHRCHENME